MRKLAILVAVGSVVVLAACGGGSNSGGGGSSTITSVTVSCAQSTVSSGQSDQCMATVTGTGNFSSAVTWSTTAGQVSSSGLLTAPVVSSSTMVTVTATSSQNSAISGAASVTVNPTAAANNVAPLIVDAGPDPANFISANVSFVTIQICVPGIAPPSNQCQTIDHVSVDTGSSGLRIVSSILTISLPPEDDSNNNPLAECLVFLDGYVWGPVASADIYVAGEKASNVPVQVMIPPTTAPPVPSSCSSQSMGPNGNEGGSVDAFGANALIGVGLFQHDCPACTNQGNNSPPDQYYDCPGGSSCGANGIFVTLAQQVANPVPLFASDNNGVLIQLPSVPDGGVASVSGSLIFGIGTQSNNGLGSATVYPAVPDTGNDPGSFTTIFNNASYPGSFIDSGSNGIFFLNNGASGLPPCQQSGKTWYCPGSATSFTAVNQGSNGVSGPTTHFTIENTDSLFNTSNTAFSTLGGPSTTMSGSCASNPNCFFDWGLSFFYGRNVFTAVENESTPGGSGPYFAYTLP